MSTRITTIDTYLGTCELTQFCGPQLEDVQDRRFIQIGDELRLSQDDTVDLVVALDAWLTTVGRKGTENDEIHYLQAERKRLRVIVEKADRIIRGLAPAALASESWDAIGEALGAPKDRSALKEGI